MAGAQQRQQVIERGADLGEVGFDVGEGGRAEREHDVLGAGRRLGAIGELQETGGKHAIEHLLGAGLLERHLAVAQRAGDRRVVIDADHVPATVGEAQRERQTDPPQADDRDVSLVAHGRDGSVVVAGEAAHRGEAVLQALAAHFTDECDP